MDNKFVLLLIISCVVAQCHAAARLIRLPLRRATTQSAGEFNQPVVNYYTQIQIGTPPVSFNIQFDIGSQEHFVPHYSWNPFNRNLHYGNGFQCKSSSSCRKDDRVVSIDYQNCQLTGKRYEDNITLVNVNSQPTNVTQQVIDPTALGQPVTWRQNFLAISSASDGRFSPLPVDGYFGLALAPQSLALLKNILISLHEVNLLDNLQFSLWFNPVLDSPLGGELILGGVDTSRYQGQIYWHTSIGLTYNYWTLNLQYVLLGNQYVSTCSSGPAVGCVAKLSSGLSDIYGPEGDVKQLYNMLNTSSQSNGLQLIDCRRMSQLPVLTFSIDGIPYRLLPSNYIRKTVDGVIFKKETCYVAILPSQTALEWTLSTNFLGAYYSIFDMTYKQIGFAALR